MPGVACRLFHKWIELGIKDDWNATDLLVAHIRKKDDAQVLHDVRGFGVNTLRGKSIVFSGVCCGGIANILRNDLWFCKVGRPAIPHSYCTIV